MQRLVLTADQSKKLTKSLGTVEVVDSQGRSIGQFTLTNPTVSETLVMSAEALAEMRLHTKESVLDKGPSSKTRQISEKS